MKTLYSKAGFSIFALGLSLSGWAASPCMPIAMECMKNGFYKGGDKVGKGLVKDCVLPVVMKKMNLANTSFTDPELAACKEEVIEQMKNKMENQS